MARFAGDARSGLYLLVNLPVQKVAVHALLLLLHRAEAEIAQYGRGLGALGYVVEGLEMHALLPSLDLLDMALSARLGPADLCRIGHGGGRAGQQQGHQQGGGKKAEAAWTRPDGHELGRDMG
jgi:hypothetical protein